MTKRILFFDFLLLAGLAMGAMTLRDQWRNFESLNQVEAIQAITEAPVTTGQTSAAVLAPAPDWTDIPGRNLFSFDRNDIAIVAEAPTPPGPKPFFFGTLSIGSQRMAMVGPGRPGNRSYRPTKTGEVVDGWTVTEIQDKSVVVSSNGITETLIMNDPTAQVPRERTRTSAASTPPVQVIERAPAQAPPAARAGSSATSNAPPPSPSQPPPGQRAIQTPFGTAFVRDQP